MMTEYKIAETFTSINGEGQKAGELAFFVRFCSCNLKCTYCDTKWANQADVKYTVMDENEIYSMIKHSGIKNVTLTGGEPLLNKSIMSLLTVLGSDGSLSVEIETNGSIDLSEYISMYGSISYTMDYKLQGSGMERYMKISNFDILRKCDTVKFVSSGEDDLKRAKEIIDRYNLTERVRVYISPVFGCMEPADIVDFMKINSMNNVRLQLQLHKFIWDPDKKGV